MLLVQHFVVGTPARAVAKVCGINKDTACTWYHRFRTIIAIHLQQDTPLLDREVEADAHEVSACPYLKKYSHAYVTLVGTEKVKGEEVPLVKLPYLACTKEMGMCTL